MKTNKSTGIPNIVNKEAITDKAKIKEVGTELFGGYTISWRTLFTNENLSLFRFLFDSKYRADVKDEFYEYLNTSIGTANFYGDINKLKELKDRIASIPLDQLSDEGVGLLNKKSLLDAINKSPHKKHI